MKYFDLYLSTVLQNGFYIYFLISQYVNKKFKLYYIKKFNIQTTDKI